jgi:hypothetical protein
LSAPDPLYTLIKVVLLSGGNGSTPIPCGEPHGAKKIWEEER